MYWNHRIVDDSKNNGGEPWFTVAEVFYDENNKPTGWTPPCFGTERAEDVVELLERMLADIKRAPEPVEFLEVTIPDEPDDLSGIPGEPAHDPFLAHELLDRSCMLQEMVDKYLLYHPLVDRTPEYKDLAEKASDALVKLYQLIGDRTL